MASLHRVKELRFLSGTTFQTAWSSGAGDETDDANATAWAAGTATKVRMAAMPDFSGLEYKFAENPTIESQHMVGRDPIPTLGDGSFKFSMFLSGANSDATASSLATVMSKIMGGVENPGARTDEADSSGTHTATRLYAAGIEGNVKPGVGVLVGTRGDGRGEAEARPISAEGTDFIDVPMAWSAAPNNNDAVVLATTVYYHPEATQDYLHFLAIGHSAEDQQQMLSCMGGFELSDLAPGEVPMVTFELSCAVWQEVPSGQRDQLEPGTAPSGNILKPELGRGGFFLQDNGTTTRATFKAANISIDPGVAYVAVPDPNGVNGIGGWQKQFSPPTCEFDLILEGNADPLPGLYDDFANGAAAAGAQAKQLILQWGHTAQRCCMIDFQKFWIDGAPVRSEVGGLAAVKVKGHGEFAPMSDPTDADTALANSPMRIHEF